MMPTDEVIDAKIEAALEEPLRTLKEHGDARLTATLFTTRPR